MSSWVWCRCFRRQRTTFQKEQMRLVHTGTFWQCQPTKGRLAPVPSTMPRHPFLLWAELATWRMCPIQLSEVLLDLPDPEGLYAELHLGHSILGTFWLLLQRSHLHHHHSGVLPHWGQLVWEMGLMEHPHLGQWILPAWNVRKFRIKYRKLRKSSEISN